MDLHDKLLEVSRLFRIEYEYLGYETIQMGNVNRTYKVNFMLPEGKPKSFLVQNVNTYAFRNPIGLMDNIDKVTEHIRAKKPGQLALHFHHTADRKAYVVDGRNFWRMTNYVHSVTFNSVTDLDIIRNAGKAFGEFQMDLHDFDISELIETIPGFHNTRQRYEKFIQSVQENKAGRAAEVQEINRRPLLGKVVVLLRLPRAEQHQLPRLGHGVGQVALALQNIKEMVVCPPVPAGAAAVAVLHHLLAAAV